ncbi:hypothetical protein IW261DRAFT_1576493 [Armillaria novae-zelandiae]|uniref:Aminoglycoside phosphotransferase domain-containing protein n=1 Tax=Armillaria novae-zelandiae TaxID=153914 RepID=A0AA39T3N7_9AGAR|nr:hypothetical protein IW261DRAFT_1576493 [Armillaria novae-zelandiae]
MAQNVTLLEARIINATERPCSRLRCVQKTRDFNVYHGVLDKFGEISVRVRILLARDGGAITPYQVMLSEFATLSFLRSQVPKSVPVQIPICIDEDKDTLVGGPWMVTTLTRGPFLNEIIHNLNYEQREIVINSVAETYYRILMSRSSTFSKTGSIYRHEDREKMARDWFYTDPDSNRNVQSRSGCFVGPMAVCPPDSKRFNFNTVPPNIWHCGPFESADKWLAAIASRHFDYTGALSDLSLDEQRDRERDVNGILGRMSKKDRDFSKRLVLEHPTFSLSCIQVDAADPTKIVSISRLAGARIVPSWAINPPFEIPENLGQAEQMRLLTIFAWGVLRKFPEPDWRNSSMFDKLLIAQNSHVDPNDITSVFRNKTSLQKMLTFEKKNKLLDDRLPKELDSIIDRFSE